MSPPNPKSYNVRKLLLYQQVIAQLYNLQTLNPGFCGRQAQKAQKAELLASLETMKEACKICLAPSPGFRAKV